MFNEDLSPFFDLDDFAIVAVFYKNYGEVIETSTEIKVIFDHEFISVDNSQLVYDGYKPVVYCKTTDVSIFSYNDIVELSDATISGIFKIVSKQADGTGISTLILNEYNFVVVPPVASNDTSIDNTEGLQVSLSVLSNDIAGTYAINPATVKITGTANYGDSLMVAGEGTWSVNEGVITFKPLISFTGDPTPVTYTVEDIRGNVSNEASVTVTYNLMYGVNENITFLLHSNTFNGDTVFIDSSINNGSIIATNVIHSSARQYFNASSILFNGNGKLTLYDSSDFVFDGDFTIDYWVYAIGAGSTGLANYASSNKFHSLYLDTATSGRVIINGVNVIPNIMLLPNQWNHYALIREDNLLSAYVNGLRIDVVSYTNTIGSNTMNYIGGTPLVTHAADAYIDEFRISKGFAAWSGTSFTPHDKPYLTP